MLPDEELEELEPNVGDVHHDDDIDDGPEMDEHFNAFFEQGDIDVELDE